MTGVDNSSPVDSQDAIPESARESLTGRTYAPHELPSLIEIILSDENGTESIPHLTADGAQTFVDVIHQALHTLDLPPLTRKKSLKLLYRTCGCHALLPKGLEIPVSYDRNKEALYRGGYADVWKGDYLGRDVAVKVIRTYSDSNLKKVVHGFCKEVVIWSSLRHPNILPLTGAIVSENRLAMVSDWMKNRDINTFIKTHPEANRLTLLVGVTEGLIYLHGNEMVHGDLKGLNVLIDETGNARLADFGLLTVISDNANLVPTSSFGGPVGTTQWMGPELFFPERFGLSKSRPTKASDCYALGMVIYETISGNIPFQGVANWIIPMKVGQGERPDRGPGFPDRLWKMLESCWVSDPKDRPEVGVVLECLLEVRKGVDRGTGMKHEE